MGPFGKQDGTLSFALYHYYPGPTIIRYTIPIIPADFAPSL